MSCAIYPGTFDPMTNGHVDIILRSICMFNKIIIVVANGYNKHTLLTIKERIYIIKKLFYNYKNIEITSHNGLISDIFDHYNCCVMIRGVRTIIDFNYELQMFYSNLKLNNNIEVVFIPSKLNNSFISSTLVKELFALKSSKLVSFVPKIVLDYLMHNK